MLTCRIVDIGRSEYDEALKLQEDLVAEKLAGAEDDFLILTEHDPVITIGRRGSEGDLLADQNVFERRGITVREVTRGGAATYHGPGQLVAYPVMDLNHYGRDIHRYLRSLESCTIAALSCLGIDSRRIDGKTGVWVEGEKIASIGVAVRRWITYHGLSINVGDLLGGFDSIVPCGMTDCRMTSVSTGLGRPVSIEEFKTVFLPAFREEFGCDTADYQLSGLQEAVL